VSVDPYLGMAYACMYTDRLKLREANLDQADRDWVRNSPSGKVRWLDHHWFGNCRYESAAGDRDDFDKAHLVLPTHEEYMRCEPAPLDDSEIQDLAHRMQYGRSWKTKLGLST